MERLDLPDSFFSWVLPGTVHLKRVQGACYWASVISSLLILLCNYPSLTAQACAELRWTWLPLLGALEANSSIRVLDGTRLGNNQFIFPSLSLVR